MDTAATNITLQAQAPGKLILLGEYAVLRGAPALVMAINRYARIFLQPSPDGQGIIIAPDVGIHNLSYHWDDQQGVVLDHTADTHTVAFVKAALALMHQRYNLSPLRITISSAEFFYQNTRTKLGLGSSAAVTVGLIAALLKWVSPSSFPTDDTFKLTVLELALATHRQAQGNQGSGIDIAASTFGGVLQYTMPVISTQLPPEIRVMSIPTGLYLRFIWTRQAAATTELLHQVNKLRDTHPVTFRQIFSQLIYLAEQGTLHFQHQDVPAFLEIVEQYFQTLKSLTKAAGAPIISEVHQEIHAIAHRHRAVYKPSGAGGGDFGILLAQNEFNVIDAIRELEKKGFISFNFQIDPRGVITNERGD